MSKICESLKQQWTDYQTENATRIIEADLVPQPSIKYIGGLDISFDPLDNNRACAFLSVYDLRVNRIVYEDHLLCTMAVPYVSGFLGFREIPHTTSSYFAPSKKHTVTCTPMY